MNSIYRFSEHILDKVFPELTIQDLCHIVTLMKIVLKEDAEHDSLVVYLDGFIFEYFDRFNG